MELPNLAEELSLSEPGELRDGSILAMHEGKMVEWVDILPQLDAAAEEMELGDLLAGPSFDLQDAMSALEMMDPQMDTGMATAASPEDEAPMPTLPDDVPAPLLIGLLDDITCAEHGWYRGLSLIQTVYQVEWMQTAPDVVHQPLRAALCATARAVAAARSIVLRGDVHEEEDFNGSLSGLILHDGVSDEDVVNLMAEAEEACAAAAAAAQAKVKGPNVEAAKPETDAADGAGASDAAAAPSEAESAARLAEAVLCRIRFRRAFTFAVLQIARPSPEALEVARSVITMAEAQLKDIAGSIELGTPREELGHMLGGRAVRQRLGSAPTKKAEWLSRIEGVTASTQLLSELKQLCGIVAAAEDYDGFSRWFGGLTCGRPTQCILTRSAVQLIGVAEGKGGCGLRPGIAALLAGIISAYSGVPEPLTRELLSLAPVTELMQQMGQGELSRLRLRNINPARARRRLRHFLHDWAPLQELAETLDAQLEHAGYLTAGMGPYGAWCLHRTLSDMLWFIALGFELELYAPCEYAFVYW